MCDTVCVVCCVLCVVFFQAEDGIRDLVRSRGLGDVYKRQVWVCDNMAKNNAIKMIMIDQLPMAALTDNITYSDKSTTAVLASPVVG